MLARRCDAMPANQYTSMPSNQYTNKAAEQFAGKCVGGQLLSFPGSVLKVEMD